MKNGGKIKKKQYFFKVRILTLRNTGLCCMQIKVEKEFGDCQ